MLAFDLPIMTNDLMVANLLATSVSILADPQRYQRLSFLHVNRRDVTRQWPVGVRATAQLSAKRQPRP